MITREQMILVDSDHQQLLEMIRALRRDFPAAGDPYQRYLQALEQRICEATVVEADRISRRIVTMNSIVRVRELDTNRRRTIRLVYESEADAFGGRVSVLTGLGAALLGARQGQVVQWQSRSGVRRLRIERILYQPQAAGAMEVVKQRS